MTNIKRLTPNAYARTNDDNSIELISYMTLVCRVSADGWFTCTGTYSPTTRKHISRFMRDFIPNGDYFLAKQCYTDNIAYNIYTGEIIDL